jgi:hypothetical protein
MPFDADLIGWSGPEIDVRWQRLILMLPGSARSSPLPGRPGVRVSSSIARMRDDFKKSRNVGS